MADMMSDLDTYEMSELDDKQADVPHRLCPRIGDLEHRIFELRPEPTPKPVAKPKPEPKPMSEKACIVSATTKPLNEGNIQQSDIAMPQENEEMDRVATSMKSKLVLMPPPNSKCCIYTVPGYIRKVNEECYWPLVMSIGPVFYRDQTLETLKDLKWTFLKSLLQHPHNTSKSLDPYVKFVRDIEVDIRACYQDQVKELNSDELIEMTVLDAAFLIYLFVVASKSADLPSVCTPKPSIESELFVLTSWLGRDIFLEENQLPFFVLMGMYDIAFGTVYPRRSFIDLTLEYIGRLSTGMPGPKAIQSIIDGKKITDASTIQHLVDLRRMCCCLRFYEQQDSEEEHPFHEFNSAKQLSDAGVKFKLNESENPLEIIFEKNNGVLKIPKLSLYDETEPVLRSILFFEQSHGYKDRYFTDYIFFLDKLIDTVEDIQILQQSEILDNQLGSNEDAAVFFNKLTKYIFYSRSNFAYSNITKGLKDYASTNWNQWKAILWSKYFDHPWAIISVIAAIFLFILTLLQTITGFLQLK